MNLNFNSYGHENILSNHRNTIEFTKDKDLTKNGDCIVGVNSDFDYSELKEFIKHAENKEVTATISAEGVKDEFSFFINNDFDDEHEIVIRKTDFSSKRTLGINANKAAKDIKRELIEKIKDRKIKIKVSLSIK